MIPATEWQAYLQKSLAENKPYNVLRGEILGADGVDLRCGLRRNSI